MYHYRIYCTDIYSDIKFIQLKELTDTPGDNESAVYIRAGKFPEELIPEKECFSIIKENGSFLTNSYCLIYIADQNTIQYEIRPGVDPGRIPNYLLGWGLSILFFERGQAVIHCSALYNEKGAFLISGQSGSGKSTMTSMLLEKGFSFMADDTSLAFVRGGVPFATSCYPYRKLCRDVVEANDLNEDDLIYIDEDKDKFLVPYEGEFPEEPVKINALVFIEKVYAGPDGVIPTSEIVEVTGMNRVNYIRKSLFLDRLFDEKTPGKMVFKMCLELAGKIPVYIVTRPVGKDSRDEVLANILKVTENS